MAGDTRKLLVEILGDAKGFGKATDEVAEKSNGLKDHLGGIAAAVGGAFSVAAIGAFAKGAVDSYGEVAGATLELQRLTGGTAEDMSRMSFAAEETGVSNETLEKSIKKLSKAAIGATDAEKVKYDALEKSNTKIDEQITALEKLSNPTQAQTDHLAALKVQYDANNEAMSELGTGASKLGFSLYDANGAMKSTHEILLEVADKFKSMPDGIEKNALAMKLFGKAGTDMIPFLDRGKDGIAELEKQSDKFGLTIGQGAVDAMLKNKLASKEWHAAIKGLEVQFGQYLMPVLTKVTSFLAEHVPPVMQGIKRIFKEDVAPAVAFLAKVFRDDIIPVIQKVGDKFGELVGYIRAHWAAISEVINKAIGYIRGIVDTYVTVVVALWHRFGDTILNYLRGAWDAIKQIVSGALDVITGVVQFFFDLFRGKWSKAWDDIKKVFSGVWDIIVGYIKFVINEIETVLSLAWDAIGGAVTTAWNGIVSFLAGIWHTIAGAMTTAWDGFVGFFGKLPGRILGTIGSLAGLLVNAGADLVSGLWNGIKYVMGAVFQYFADLPGNMIRGVGAVGDVLFDLGKGLINGMLRGLAWAWNKVSDFFSVHIGGGSFLGVDLPSFNFKPLGHWTPPQLAEGGIVRARNGGTLVNVGEGGRDEAVIPLPKGGLNMGGNTPVNLVLDGRILATVLVPHMRTHLRGLQ